MAKIIIKWGQFKEGYAFGPGSYSSTSRKVHLVASEPFNHTAACGVVTTATSEFATGWLCTTCAKALGIKSADEFGSCRRRRVPMGTRKRHGSTQDD